MSPCFVNGSCQGFFFLVAQENDGVDHFGAAG